MQLLLQNYHSQFLQTVTRRCFIRTENFDNFDHFSVYKDNIPQSQTIKASFCYMAKEMYVDVKRNTPGQKA